MSPVALPAEILALICCDALQSGISPATLLTLNSHWHGATSSILYSCLAVPVSSVLLSTASGSTQEDYCSTGCVWLNRLLGKYGAITRNHKYAEAVKALYILPNDWPLLDEQAAHDPHVEASNTGSREIGSDLNDLGTSDLKIMTESQVVNLVKNYLTGIQSLSWLLPGPPSATFMAQLQNAQIRLLSVDIVTSPQVLLRNSTICSLDGYPATLSSSMTRGYPALRWDLACLQAFDVRHLVRLTLQNLSLEGIRTLGLLSSALIGCQELSLYNTLFVDDVLLSSVASAMQKLEILRIKHMAGTKLTSKGIAAIMEQCENLQEFELLDVQGKELSDQLDGRLA